MDTLINFFEEISRFWWAVLGGVITLIAYFILEKFKNRMFYFESTLSFNSLGTSLNDNLFGDIKIIHNNQEIKHLNFITINIKNTSNADFENLNIICWVDNTSQILVWSGNYDDTKIAVKLDKNHANQLNEFHQKIETFFDENGSSDLPKDLAAELYFFSRNKEIFLPVFNRNSSVTLNFLVENFEGNVPVIQFPVQHKSVKVLPAENKEKKNKKLGQAMFLYGYIILFVAIFWIFSRNSISTNDLIIFVIVSTLYLWLGLLIFEIKKYVMSFFK